jgi:predicted MFS family arabinose efflux permease
MGNPPRENMSIGLSAQGGYPRALVRWWVASVLGFACAVAYLARLILAPLLDPIRQELRISDSEISLLQGAAFAVVYAFAALPLGRLADRRRRLTVLTACAALWSFGIICCGLAPGFWTMFVSRLLVGVGEAALLPASVSILADTFPPDRRGTAVGILLIGCTLGVPAAYVTGGTLLTFAQDGGLSAIPLLGQLTAWRQVLVAVGLAGLIVPLLFLSLREPPRKSVTELQTSTFATIIRFWADRRLLVPLYLGMALLAIGDFSLYSWGPSILSRKFQLRPDIVGLSFGGVCAVASIIGTALGGVLADLATRRGNFAAKLQLSALAAALAAGGVIFVSGPTMAFVLSGSGVWIFASQLSFTSAYVALQSVVPDEHRCTGLALVAFCNILLGLGLGPSLVALATQTIFADPRAVGFSITIIALCSGVLAYALFIRARIVTDERCLGKAIAQELDRDK